MKKIISLSATSEVGEKIKVDYFLLDDTYKDKPSTFEMKFISNKKIYTYGFSILNGSVSKEFLFQHTKTKHRVLFQRKNQLIEVGSHFEEGNDFANKTRENVLFLSKCADGDGMISKQISIWFRRHLYALSGLDDTGYKVFTKKTIYNDEKFRQKLLGVIKALDIDVVDIFAQENEVPETEGISEYLRENLKYTVHTKKLQRGKNGKYGHVIFNLDSKESEGTKKLIYLLGPIIDSLETNQVVFIDEFDTRLHPLMSRKILSIFNDIANKGSQFVFITHDTNLLLCDLLRRDQVWFAEKTPQKFTSLFSLSELGERNDKKDYSKDYIDGKYGAIPFINADKLKQILN